MTDINYPRPKIEKPRKYNYKNVEVGDMVVIKRDHAFLSGIKGLTGIVTRKWPKETGLTVALPKPVTVTYLGHNPQLIDSVTLRVSYFSF